MSASSAFWTDWCGAEEQAPSTPLRDRNDNPKVAAEIVDAFNKRYGVRPGFRANHANAESFKRRHALKHNHEPPT